MYMKFLCRNVKNNINFLYKHETANKFIYILDFERIILGFSLVSRQSNYYNFLSIYYEDVLIITVVT